VLLPICVYILQHTVRYILSLVCSTHLTNLDTMRPFASSFNKKRVNLLSESALRPLISPVPPANAINRHLLYADPALVNVFGLIKATELWVLSALEPTNSWTIIVDIGDFSTTNSSRN